MDEIQGGDGNLMAICAEAPWCFGIDPESGDQMETCVYSKLIQLGYSSQSSESAGGGDGRSANYVSHSAYPDTPRNETVGKMQPECLKLARIIQKCKMKQSASAANNCINKEEKRAPPILRPPGSRGIRTKG